MFSVCNFQSMESPVELNGPLSKVFSDITLFSHITGGLASETFKLNPIVSWK